VRKCEVLFLATALVVLLGRPAIPLGVDRCCEARSFWGWTWKLALLDIEALDERRLE
jgi:hypothetical protein